MGFRAVKPHRFFVQRDIQMLVRTFPSETVVIQRGIRVYSPTGQQRWNYIMVYRGEALVVPTSGQVQDFGLGQVEDLNPRLLIAGTREILQGDFVTISGRVQQVEFAPNWWHAFQVVTLQQFQQGT